MKILMYLIRQFGLPVFVVLGVYCLKRVCNQGMHGDGHCNFIMLAAIVLK